MHKHTICHEHLNHAYDVMHVNIYYYCKTTKIIFIVHFIQLCKRNLASVWESAIKIPLTRAEHID